MMFTWRVIYYLNMTDQPGTAIKRSVERCQQREGMSEADAEAILDAHRHIELLGPSEISKSHHSDILMRSVKMAREVGGLADALEDGDALLKTVATDEIAEVEDATVASLELEFVKCPAISKIPTISYEGVAAVEDPREGDND